MSTGKIWPEYFIDCSRCDFHEPLSCTKSPAVAARKMGWRRDEKNTIEGPWVCPKCQERATQ